MMGNFFRRIEFKDLLNEFEVYLECGMVVMN